MIIQLLSTLTTIVNLLGLALSLCLGLYVVTRSPRSRLSWLAALALWCLTCFFLHNVLVINLPQSSVLPWLRPLVIFILPLWFHLTRRLLPRRARRQLWYYLPLLRLPINIRRRIWALAPTISRLGLPLVYGLTLALVAGGAFPLSPPSEADTGPAVCLSDRVAGQLYPLAVVFLVVLSGLGVLNLGQGRRLDHSRIRRRQFTRLLVATILAGLGALYLGLGVWLGLYVPSLPGDVVMGIAAAIFGYTIAQYNALLEGRTVERDLLYIFLAIGSLTLFYVVVAEVLYLGGHVFSALTLILIIVVAVTSLMLYDGLRTTLDRLFYREQFRQLRANLRALAREVGTSQALPERLQVLLSTLCRTLHATKGFVALRREDAFVCQAAEKVDLTDLTFPVSDLATTEIVSLPRPATSGLRGMALLVPLYAGGNQIGALVLGPREMGQPYSEEDLMLLDDLADQLATVIRTSQLQEENARAISEMVADFRERERALQRQVQQMLAEREEDDQPVLEGVDEQGFVSLVEDALRRLYDFPYLGEHTLAQLQVVNWRLEDRRETFVTHIDRGKALSEVLLQALHKLRPEGADPQPNIVPSREWHQFITLHDSYVLGELNRDIMSRLYVSEGTFHRTRRRAVRGVARALQEIELQTQQGGAL
jgi:hypothetical protein